MKGLLATFEKWCKNPSFIRKGKDIPKTISDLASILVWYDTDFLDHYYANLPTEVSATRFRLCGRLWDKNTVAERSNLITLNCCQDGINYNKEEDFENIKAFLGNINQDNLLQNLCILTVEICNKIAESKTGEKIASPIFLYDSHLDELVLAASYGYPFQIILNQKRAQDLLTSLAEAEKAVNGNTNTNVGKALKAVKNAAAKAVAYAGTVAEKAQTKANAAQKKANAAKAKEAKKKAEEAKKKADAAKKKADAAKKKADAANTKAENLSNKSAIKDIKQVLETVEKLSIVSMAKSFLNGRRLLLLHKMKTDQSNSGLDVSRLFHGDWMSIQYSSLPAEENSCAELLDCNTILPGIIAYTPDKGITGKLLFPETNKELERPGLEDVNITDLSPAIMPPKGDKYGIRYDEFFNEHLKNRAVSYESRSEMTAGRQTTAGTFESLQFMQCAKDYTQVGAFLGTALRFCGESFGVLKSEIYKTEGYPINAPKAEMSNFANKELIKTLVQYAYIVSAILFFMKYNKQIALRTLIPYHNK